LEQRSSEHEQLIQEQWRLRKELAALQRIGEQYDTLAETHDRLATRETDVREALQALLKDVKALAGELRRGH
jgi:prefoldin subunit 5